MARISELTTGKDSRSTNVALTTLGLLFFGFFGFLNLSFSQLPPSTHAPHVGQKAPDFTLADQNGKSVSLASLLKPSGSAVGKGGGVILIFYRGYW